MRSNVRNITVLFQRQGESPVAELTFIPVSNRNVFKSEKVYEGHLDISTAELLIARWPTCLLTSGKSELKFFALPLSLPGLWPLSPTVDTRNLTTGLQSNTLDQRMVNHSHNKTPLTRLRESGRGR